MNTRLLTVELAKDGDAVEIHCNREGIEELIRMLTRLAERGTADHCHLRTPEWAGSELSSEKQSVDGTLINAVTVRFWPAV
jgi:hypothetical protein